MRRSCDTSEHSRAVDIPGPMSVAIRLKTGPQRRRRTPRHGATKRSSHPPLQRRRLDVETNKFFFSVSLKLKDTRKMFRDFDHSDEKIFPSTRINLAEVTSDMDLRKWPQFRSYQSFFFVLKATGQFAFTDLRLTCRVEYNWKTSAA